MARVRASSRRNRRADSFLARTSSPQPLICFAVIITIFILYRLVSILNAVTGQCTETNQFWYTPADGNWPLVASFFFVFFLLLIWSVAIAFEYWKQPNGEKAVIVVNIIAAISCLYTFRALHETALYDVFMETNPRTANQIEDIRQGYGFANQRDKCTIYQLFSGRWRVVNRSIGVRGADIPMKWIVLLPWGDLYAENEYASHPYEGGWWPPRQNPYSADKRWRYGHIWIDGSGAAWNFDRQGDQLILSTPDEYYELQKSTITLERVEHTPARYEHLLN